MAYAPSSVNMILPTNMAILVCLGIGAVVIVLSVFTFKWHWDRRRVRGLVLGSNKDIENASSPNTKAGSRSGNADRTAHGRSTSLDMSSNKAQWGSDLRARSSNASDTSHGRSTSLEMASQVAQWGSDVRV